MVPGATATHEATPTQAELSTRALAVEAETRAPTPKQKAIPTREALVTTVIEDRGIFEVDISFACGPSIDGGLSDVQVDSLPWSQDGSRSVIILDDSVWVLDFNTSGIEKLVDANPVSEPYPNRYPVSVYGFYADLSPDGQRVVYSTCQYPSIGLSTPGPDQSTRSNLGYEIAVINTDGSRQRRMTENAHLDHYPMWSPDGTKIAFVSTPRSSRGSNYDVRTAQLMVLGDSPAGGPVSRPRFATSAIRVALYPPLWSPDGQRLAFLAHGTGQDRRIYLHTVKSDRSELSKISQTTILPTWSPDSDKIAFVTEQGQVSHIHTSSYDGTETRQIWSGELSAPITRISWSPDGAEILVVSGWLWAVSSDGSDSRVIGSPNPPIWLEDAVWSSDGSRILARGSGPFGFTHWSYGQLDVITEPGPVGAYHRDRGRDLKILSMDRNGANVRMLVGLDDDATGNDVDLESALYAWSKPHHETSADLASCSEGYVVPEPDENLGLVQDCEVLLRIRDKLAGNATLNWDSSQRISQWDGITIEGSPPRVEKLQFAAAGLNGVVPPELGQLTELKSLQLSGESPLPRNALTGSIPPELGNLTKLESLSLDWNFLSGPVPKELWNMTSLTYLRIGGNFLTGCVPEGFIHVMAEHIWLGVCDPAEGPSS